jgi:hypothetical protein
MNTQIDDSLRNRFSVVLDAGTLEHVFNFPQAIRNCMEMVKVGGHVIQITGGNDFMGHGFYQFSPELLYRVFSKDNGFKVEAMALYEMLALRPGTGQAGKWYRMQDPAALGHRVELTTRGPSYLLTLATRTADAPIFATWPQQSDYVTMWGSAPEGAAPKGSGAAPPRAPGKLRQMVPAAAVRGVRRLCGPGVNSAVDRLADAAVLDGRF